jgi:hypothetical protein
MKVNAETSAVVSTDLGSGSRRERYETAPCAIDAAATRLAIVAPAPMAWPRSGEPRLFST